MPDLLFLLTAGAFFGICVLYVRGCERIVRGAEESESETGR